MFKTTGKLLYSVKVSEPTREDATGAYRNPEYKDKLFDNFEDNPLNNMWEMFDQVAKKYKDRDCLGTRVKVDNKLGPYKWKSFTEIRELILAVGSGLVNTNACPVIRCDDTKVTRARFLGFYMPNCEEWNICDLSCSAFNIVTVPLYDSLGVESSKFILEQTLMQTIICNKACAMNLFKSLDLCERIYLKKLILVENEADTEIKEACEKHQLTIILWKDLVESGKKKLQEPRPGNLKDIACICYTSGTTGYPKGVIMTNGNFVAQLASSITGPSRMTLLDINENDTHISYLPLAHIYERIMVLVFCAQGVRTGYYSGNVQTLVEDIQELKPTLFISVPRLYNRIHERIFNSLKKKSSVVQSLFNKGLEHKIKKLNNNGIPFHFFWDKLVFNKAKKILGGNVRAMLNGSAPISPDVVKKLKAVFSVPIFEGYGMTETLGPAFISHSTDVNIGHIGGPVPCVEYRVVSVPEMNYLITDNPPRGELHLRGPAITNLGYFKLEKETNDFIDNEGWISTGDIVSFSENGSITIIDRKKNIFKLSQGEYIAVEKIESVYRQSLYISQIFVFGYSYESVLVCIVCPSLDTIEIWKNQKKINKTDEEVMQMPEYKRDVIDDLIKMGKKDGLKGYEQIKDVYFATEPFTIENDLLTPTGKIKRHAVQKKYKEQIDEMYRQLKAAA
ncbi:acyl-CoA synthetase, putative [Plasmodium knowlesi strain H]|uniref:Long-chain-fatty-acid--CoA ligase n=3 Tax=Plasmodium knowlesi TaxID=5850 RepID=A0A5K1U8M4_PLAKH|nr:acyl-CoA synthetase, putative [Plasmodium knowlesi strain H]OTN67109.1 putative Acyl-CoA synthetase [Plasmodium knowlesi]CAA9988583.1 acyl-CoA synthetase, putative [Plasmodium knowlesi strain H]SBO21397.1 acyl-CoA synthetase, putative [Plasmodium knowlesi strain H]SBO21850.1 acyl-CoA synthetase, putative [Plasmodium knowlesi strain H]VVS78057.1 acyl-CoA synthetase, putative [Plasmodium knowlesi strain H]|eukprot:XP_002259559.1 long-chain fatty acid CoA ligase, putative [Plasmodium knowlesi strain H]